MGNFTFDNLTNLTINWDVILIYLFTFLTFVALFFMSKKKLAFSIRTLTALILGLGIGLLFTYAFKIDTDTIIKHMNPYRSALRSIFSALVIPLITVAIIRSFTSLQDTVQLRKIGAKSIAWLLGTTAIATVLGIIVATITKVGTNFPTTGADPSKAREIPEFYDVILGFLPKNIINDMANNNVIPVILVAVVISIAVIMEESRNPEKVKPFKELIDSFSTIIFRVTKMVLKFIPYAVFAIMVRAAALNGIETIKSLGLYVLVIYGAMLLHLVLVQMGLIYFIAKLNPLRFLKKIAPAQIFGFTSQSSYATMPVTISSLTKRVGVSEKIAGFVTPLGANVGMNACGGIYPAIVAVFVANVYGIDLTFGHYVILILATTISSIGIAGVPGVASLTATVVLATLGLPVEGIGIVASVGALVDMGRTAVNITGVTVVSTLVSKSENEFNEEIFNSDVEELETT